MGVSVKFPDVFRDGEPLAAHGQPFQPVNSRTYIVPIIAHPSSIR